MYILRTYSLSSFPQVNCRESRYVGCATHGVERGCVLALDMEREGEMLSNLNSGIRNNSTSSSFEGGGRRACTGNIDVTYIQAECSHMLSRYPGLLGMYVVALLDAGAADDAAHFPNLRPATGELPVGPGQRSPPAAAMPLRSASAPYRLIPTVQSSGAGGPTHSHARSASQPENFPVQKKQE
jgi:hypothetical protein